MFWANLVDVFPQCLDTNSVVLLLLFYNALVIFLQY